MEKYFYNFLLILFSLAFFYIFKNFWPKYFETKATNQATKEDIGEITEIVENIKSDLLKQNEILKAQISFNNQHRLNLKNAEREALFAFNKHIAAWFYYLIRFSFSNYDINNYQEIKQSLKEFAKRQYDSDLAEAHLTLFMQDQEFIDLKKDLVISIIELEFILTKAVNELHYKYSKAEFELSQAQSDFAKQTLIRNSLREETYSLQKKSSDDSIEQFKKLNILYKKMIKLINKRLKQIESDENSI
ncbi:hypothetical protein BD847_0507 [Flavobacterium cutihirudinis]|uniref:Uncharacterized protein n=1 Tax=Flavobacterium cutihirudinis TaxID=1265740 RepID=A0A3D9G1Z8_9FLAO|nr:hypothetical protein [Flavobacterium cutihirudinis]RED26587.1 hypothetical protein BD847_0507 [Flavobacterium cutihirudinis]